MAQQLIYNLINSEINAEDLVFWLTSDNSQQDSVCKQFDDVCTKAEFTVGFLDYLKSQFTCVLQAAESRTTSAAATTTKTKAKQPITLELDKDEAKVSNLTLSFQKSTASTNNSTRLNSPDCNQIDKVVKTSTPILKNSVSLSNANNGSEKNNGVFGTQEIDRAAFDLENKKWNRSHLEARPKVVKNILRDSMNKSCSDSSSNSTLNRSFDTAGTSLNNSMSSPSSSLHNQSLPAAWQTVTPKNQQKPANKSSSSSWSKKSNNANKSGKFTPRQTFSLGDFISMDQKCSKKADKTKNESSNRSKEHDDSLTVNDKMFPKIDSNPKKKKRIKPTMLNTEDSNKRGCCTKKDEISFGIVARPAIMNPTFIEAPPADECTENMNFETERQLLKQERQKKSVQIMTRCESEPLAKNPIKVISPASLISPSSDLVSSVDTLNKLIQLYCAFWDCNMIVNPMSELYFVIYLITMQYVENTKPNHEPLQITQSTDDNSSIANGIEKVADLLLEDDLGCSNLADSNEDEHSEELKKGCCSIKLKQSKTLGLFGSPHNCVYFACSVLEYQKDLLTNLDKPTLKLLAENHRIASFKPELSRFLNENYNFKSNQIQQMKQLSNAKMDESNVCFQMDTDNVENFSSEKSFRIFHKQRDTFYEIFQDWEEHHATPTWNFAAALGSRIQKMLSMHNDVTNYYHFAKLFKSQLMSSCLNHEQQEDDENLSLLRTLKLLNAEKLTQLTERLVKPMTSNGPVPVPTFQGKQEFFKSFLIHANNHLFYHHLQNCLIYEILELNNAHFDSNEIENQEFIIDDYTKRLFVNNVSSSRLLAKFLGVLTSLPYLTESNVTELVISCQISLRSQVMPPLNIHECLQNSIHQGRLSVTLPWVIEFLAMLDSTSLCLPYYLQTLEFLYYLYRASDNAHFHMSNCFMSKQTTILVKFSIGWLFELPNFPKHMYYSWQMNYRPSKLKEICRFKESESISNQISIHLDKHDIIDDVALYLCCPFLSELRILLLTGKSNINNSNPTRHITPVSSEFKKDNYDSKQLQLQLEEAFFNGQPSSTRKIVEFVSERVASCCTKYVCYIIFPAEKDNILEELRTIIINADQSESTDSHKRGPAYKTSMNEDMIALSKSYSKKIKLLCQDIVYEMCNSRIRKCIEALLPEDTLQQVKDTCVNVAVKMAMERVKKWVSTHIVEGELFVKEMNGEINKITKSTEMKNDECLQHDPDATSPTSALSLLRDYILNLLEVGGVSMTLEKVTEILNNVKDSLERREDLLPIPGKILFSLSIDFSLSLLTFRPDLMTSDIQTIFIDIWKTENLKSLESATPLTRMLAPRNILLLEKSKTTKTWETLAIFIKKLLDSDLLTIDCLSDQCVAVFRDEWQVTTLQNLSKFLSEVVSDMKSSKQQEDAERIRILLEWVAGAYHDIEFFDY